MGKNNTQQNTQTTPYEAVGTYGTDIHGITNPEDMKNTIMETANQCAYNILSNNNLTFTPFDEKEVMVYVKMIYDAFAKYVYKKMQGDNFIFIEDAIEGLYKQTLKRFAEIFSSKLFYMIVNQINSSRSYERAEKISDKFIQEFLGAFP